MSEETNRPLELDSLYLVDSGGQYPDGTTDVTRTVAIGDADAPKCATASPACSRAISRSPRARFPAGTRGSQLDRFARQYLWQAGLDYAHGTGHGVGSYPRGPRRAAAHLAGGQQPVGRRRAARAPGMILLERARLLQGRRIWHPHRESGAGRSSARSTGAEKPMLGFETLTFAPIDRSLIDLDLLTADERRWVDDYHAQVLAVVGPQLEGEVLAWLTQSCRPL